jgi:hypothetical protein
MTLTDHRIHRFCWLYILFLSTTAACGAPVTPTLPTAYIVRAGAPTTPKLRTPTLPPLATRPPAATPASLPSATATFGTSLDQYRAWMQEARAEHPYSEPIEVMWQVMQCESSGQPDQVADSYYGLFQYQPATWSGDWNPYRDSPILDPRAQIFATAKAWHDGNQHWWGCYQ